MKRLWLVLGFFVGGCLTSNGLQYDAMSETNQYRLARVRKGMSQKQVLQIMHKPYSYETFQVAEDIYDTWFYVTSPTGLDQTRMVSQNLTPLTFKNGVLVGTGYNWYYYAMKEQAGEVTLQNPKAEKPKPQGVEDKEFEKTLRQIPQNEAPPAQKQAPEEKLPPNVHIISKTEVENGNKEPPQNVGASTPCRPCSTTDCGPDRFSTLSLGVTETQVIKTFGEPIKHETFGTSNDVYDVWFYDTIASKTGRPSIIPQHQTVLIFQNAVLISMDDEKYFELKKQFESKRAPVAEASQAKSEPPLESKPYESAPVAEASQTKSEPPLESKPYESAPVAEASQAKSEPPLESKPCESAPVAEASQAKSEPPLSAKIYEPSPIAVTSIRAVSKLKKGMTKAEVTRSLGAPADQETFAIKGDEFDVWFYDVGGKNNRKIPLTFRNGILVGKTEQEYNKFKGTCKDCYDRKGERMEEDEAEQNFNYW